MQPRNFMDTIILVTGSRQHRFNRSKRVFEVLTKQPLAMFVEGGASGVDSAVRTWCFERARPIVHWQADWDHADKRAGPIRNQEMVNFLLRMQGAGSRVYCLAFPAANSVGTWDCVTKCREAGIRGRVIPLEEGAT